MGNQHGPAMYHRENCLVLCGSLDGRGVWKRTDTCVCVAESLPCSPGIITTLLVGYTPVQNRKFSLKKKKKKNTEYLYNTTVSVWNHLPKPQVLCRGILARCSTFLSTRFFIANSQCQPRASRAVYSSGSPWKQKAANHSRTQWNMNHRDMKGTLVLVTHNFSIIDDHLYLPLFGNILSWSRTWIPPNSQTPSHWDVYFSFQGFYSKM